MVTWTRGLVLLVLLPLAACGGSESGPDRERPKPRAQAVDGTFVGKLSGTNALVAVVAAPAIGKQDRRDVTVYVSDGKRLSEWFAGSVRSNSFSAASEDRDAKADGKLSGKAVTGTLKLPDGKTVRFQAARATGAAGLYDLKLSSDGKLSGASSAGVGLSGKASLEEDNGGTGTLKLADGKRHKFDVSAGADGIRLQEGQIRLIILGEGELSGAGKRRSAGDAADSSFVISAAS